MTGLHSIKLFSIIMICMIAHVPAQAQDTPPSAFTFMKRPTYDEVTLSPDGRHVASIWLHMKKSCREGAEKPPLLSTDGCHPEDLSIRTLHNIEVRNIATSEIVKTFTLPLRGFPTRLEWASDDHLLVTGFWQPFLRDNMIIIGGTRIFSVPLDDTPAKYLFTGQEGVAQQNWNLSEISNPLRHDPQNIIMPANNNGDLDLWKVNVVNGSAIRVASGKNRTFHWYTDDEGRPLMRFDCKGRSCRKVHVFKTRDSGQTWEKIKTFKTRPDEDSEEYDFWPISQSENPNQFYVMSYEDTDERQSIKLFDLESETFVKTIFEHPDVDAAGAYIDPSTGKYLGAWFYQDSLNYAFEDPQLQSHYDKLKAHFEEHDNVRLLGFNADITNAVVHVSSPSNAGEFYVYHVARNAVESLFRGNTDLPKQLPTRTDILKIPVSANLSITAYHTVPKTVSPSNPLLIMPHGGPESQDVMDYEPWIQYFASRGYQVLQVNFRGSSGYGRAFAEAGYNEWGGIMQNDLNAAIQYLYDNNKASPENSCIVGYSYGGYAALYAGAATPELVTCVVAGGGVSDLRRFLKQVKSDAGSDSGLYEYWVTSIGDPKLDKEALDSVSPINMIPAFDDPVLLLHGENDRTVDISQSKKMFKALKKAGKDTDFVMLEGQGHSNWSTHDDILYLESIEAFLLKELTGQIRP